MIVHRKRPKPPPMTDQIIDAVTNAMKDGFLVDYIELDSQEWLRFMDEVRSLSLEMYETGIKQKRIKFDGVIVQHRYHFFNRPWSDDKDASVQTL
jgi:hypothetical protein